MNIEGYRERIRPYAEREFAILAARFKGEITEAEYRECRGITYLAYGYLKTARRSVRRGWR